MDFEKLEEINKVASAIKRGEAEIGELNQFVRTVSDYTVKGEPIIEITFGTIRPLRFQLSDILPLIYSRIDAIAAHVKELKEQFKSL